MRKLPSPCVSMRSRFLVGALLVVLFVSLIPTSTASALPSTTEASAEVSLAADGDMSLPVRGGGSPAGSAVTLGAPTAQSVTLGKCYGVVCLPEFEGPKDIVVQPLVCLQHPLVQALVALTLGEHCKILAAAALTVWKAALWPITREIKQQMQATFLQLQYAAVGMANWILKDELGGGNSVTSPVLSCQWSQGKVAENNCKDAYVINQLSIMRQISLFTLAPLFALLVIQSLLKGSLFMLLRGTFIMLPVAILGSVAIVYLAQLMLNISDDFVNAIANYTDATTTYANRMTAITQAMGADQMNLFVGVWAFLLFFAGIVIYIELLLRQLGVYLVAFFIPLGFAALVWPSTAGVFKEMLKLLLALIFMKVFIAAGVAMGIEAFAFGSMAGTTDLPNQPGDSTTAGVSALIQSALILCLAAFAAAKLMAISATAIAGAEGRVLPTQNTFAKFQGVGVAMVRGGALIRNIANRTRNPGRQTFNSQTP